MAKRKKGSKVQSQAKSVAGRAPTTESLQLFGLGLEGSLAEASALAP